MDIFIIMEFILCEDYYYGYDERLHSVYSSFEEAKLFVDTFSDTKKKFYNGKDAFIRIFSMKIGSKKRVLLFDSTKS